MSLLISELLLTNIVLYSFLGLEGIIDNTKKTDDAINISISITLMLIVSSILNFYTNEYIVSPYNLELLRLIFIVFNAILASLILSWFLHKFIKSLYKDIKVFIPQAVVNSMVIGGIILNYEYWEDLEQCLYHSISFGLSFMLIALVVAFIRERVDVSSIPRALRGVPFIMILLGIISMIFVGMLGIGRYI